MSWALSVVIAFPGSSSMGHKDIAKVSKWRNKYLSCSMPVITYNLF